MSYSFIVMASLVTYKMVLAGSKSLVFVEQLQKFVAGSYSLTLVITIINTGTSYPCDISSTLVDVSCIRLTYVVSPHWGSSLALSK